MNHIIVLLCQNYNETVTKKYHGEVFTSLSDILRRVLSIDTTLSAFYVMIIMLVSLSRAASLDGRLPILVAFRCIY